MNTGQQAVSQQRDSKGRFVANETAKAAEAETAEETREVEAATDSTSIEEPEPRSTLDIVREQLELDLDSEEGESDEREQHARPEPEGDGQLELEQGEQGRGREASEDDERQDGSDQQRLTHEEYLALQEQAEEFRSKYESLAPAEEFIKYIQENKLSEKDVLQALEIASLTTQSPQEAMARLKPIYDQLVYSTGQALAPQIQALVDNGEMTEQAARQYQEALVRQAALEAQQQQQQEYQQYQQQEQEQQEQLRFQQHVQSLQQNATAWEKGMAKRDPDYNAQLYANGPTKGEQVVKELTRMVQTQGLPPSLEAQNQMLQTAYETVNNMISGLKGTQQIKPPVASGQYKNTGSVPELEIGNTTTSEIVRRMLGLS